MPYTRLARLFALAAVVLAIGILALRFGLLDNSSPPPAIALQPTETPTRAPSPTPIPPTPIPPTPIPPTSTPIPPPQLQASARISGDAVTFELRGEAPAGAEQALLWFDSESGRVIRSVPLDGGRTLSATVTISATNGLTLTHEAGGNLDFWWAVRDRAGRLTRSSAILPLPDSLARTESLTATISPQVAWVTRETPNFRLFAAPGSDAVRDLERLAVVAEASFARAATFVPPTQPISTSVYLLPRVFWQGGVAYRDGPLIISYTDRNYAGVAAWSYLVHEVTHALGGQFVDPGGEVGGVLGEGLAVLAAGGHYAVEPIDERAAALLETDRLIPLCELRYNFYAAQHEIAYLQSASYVTFLDEAYGREALLAMYREQPPQRGQGEEPLAAFCERDASIIEPAVSATRGELERAWRARLAALSPNDEERAGIELTVRLYDTMRRYQELRDPPARTLPSIPDEWDQAMAAQMLVPAAGSRAAALETLLIAAGVALRAGETERAAAILDDMEATLDAGTPSGPFARDHDEIAKLLEAQARALRLGQGEELATTLVSNVVFARLPVQPDELLHDLRFTLNTLDVRGDAAEGLVEVRGARQDGREFRGELYRVRFERRGGAWLLADWRWFEAVVEMPPSVTE
jgi:hypothetical protein